MREKEREEGTRTSLPTTKNIRRSSILSHALDGQYKMAKTNGRRYIIYIYVCVMKRTSSGNDGSGFPQLKDIIEFSICDVFFLSFHFCFVLPLALYIFRSSRDASNREDCASASARAHASSGRTPTGRRETERRKAR